MKYERIYYLMYRRADLIIGAECVLDCDANNNDKHLLKSDKEATLAAIDAALDYLEKNKK